MQIASLLSAFRPQPAALAAGAASASGNPNQAAGGNQLTPNSFIQLLSAQLQAQTPDNTMDPNQMMTELVQFNTLQQIIQMNQELGAFLSSQSSPAPPTGSTAAAR